jgi:Na+/proline symporter
VRFSGRPAAALRLLKSLYLAIPINLFAVVWCTLAMQKILEATVGITRFSAMALCLGFSVAYCLLSGLWGVVAADLIQFAVALGGAIALAWAAVAHAGGMGALTARLDAIYGAGHGLLDLLPPLGGEGGAVFSPALSGFLVWTCVLWWSSRNVDGGGALIQRMLACKDERHATGATLLFTVIHYAVRTWPWVLAALASFVFFPLAGTGAAPDPALAPFAERVARDPELAYPAMIALLPAGLRGLLLASLFAAFASTVDSFLNLSGSYLLNDVYRRFVRPRADDRHYVLVSRALVLGLALAATVIAGFARSIDQVFSFLLAFSGGIGLVYIGRWFWWRVNAWSEIAAMLASGATASAISLLPHAPAAFARYEALRTALGFDATPFRLLATVAVTCAVTLVVTLATPPVDRGRLLSFYLRARPGGLWGPIRREAERYLPPGRRPRTWPATLAACAAAVVLVGGAGVGLGDLIFGRFPRAAGLLLAAVAAGLVLARLTRRGVLGIIPNEK